MQILPLFKQNPAKQISFTHPCQPIKSMVPEKAEALKEKLITVPDGNGDDGKVLKHGNKLDLFM